MWRHYFYTFFSFAWVIVNPTAKENCYANSYLRRREKQLQLRGALGRPGAIRISSILKASEEPQGPSAALQSLPRIVHWLNNYFGEFSLLTDLGFQTHVFLLITTIFTKCMARVRSLAKEQESPQATENIAKVILLSFRSHWPSLDHLPLKHGCQRNKPSVLVSLFWQPSVGELPTSEDMRREFMKITSIALCSLRGGGCHFYIFYFIWFSRHKCELARYHIHQLANEEIKARRHWDSPNLSMSLSSKQSLKIL